MEVKLLSITPNAVDLIYQAARQCYFPGFVGDLDIENIEYAKKISLIKKVYESGHTSVYEHPYASFAVKGLSRACTHQVVRHRISSYSQQSQRFSGLGDNSFVIPKDIFDTSLNDDESCIHSSYMQLLDDIKLEYDYLIKCNIPPEDARMILPNATESNIIITMNFRSWLHFFELRCCKCAQWEIRDLANNIKNILIEQYSDIFKDIAGPKCIALGYCNEGKKSCGFKPLKEDVLKAYENSKKC